MKLSPILNSRASRVAAVAAMTIPFLVACGSSPEEDPITFAAVPSESAATLESSFENITTLIAQETGREVVFQNASDYAAVIEGMRAGQIDIASFGPFAYVIGKDSGIDMEAVVSPTDDPAQAPAYTSLAYVREGSEIKGLEDAKDKTVCFVDAASTSGFLIPSKGLMDVGIDMDTDIQQILAGGHDASLLSLSSENCDIAFAHDTMLNTLEQSGQVEPGSLVAVWESDPITEDPISVNHGSLEPELADQIINILEEKGNIPALVEAGICASEEECTLPEEIQYGFLPVDDSDFDAIREVCEITQAEACKNVS
ncbi:Phosphate-import protein PhnD precursor [Corynebacterium occultum]|uniref:Phosphate-import protein PhnD n=1 Tax=Corynebacterium occultum TaxID=2675219 RepID=A0A6B8WNL5_9CORY|nr:phosphate/phosphite/phosphonate ABC transporter substrate-binding protein [Corynebacterium occultum]QGU07958.1 Phosphate-import protein PhnD precursor [Corynebacterium occultum]